MRDMARVTETTIDRKTLRRLQRGLTVLTVRFAPPAKGVSTALIQAILSDLKNLGLEDVSIEFDSRKKGT